MLAEREQLEADKSQDRAVDMLCSAHICIITGGPGTGKTTVLRRAIETMEAMRAAAPANDNATNANATGNGAIELAAPTGKAAKRMSEATGRSARTLHRLLEWRGTFTRNADNPLHAELVVVDEASMLDIELGAALFDAIGPHTRIALVGDVNQLPPVGAGRVFADLIEAGEIPVVRLDTLHRQAQRSWVARNAPRVLAGGPIELDTFEDFELLRAPSAADVLPALQRIVAANVDAQVLIPQRGGLAGITAANNLLQRVRNTQYSPGDPCMQREDFSVYVGDRVIQTKNDYDLAVFNGDVGEVVDIKAGVPAVAFSDGTAGAERVVQYTNEKAYALQLAYALTVHKSQGSEFPHVVFVAHSTHTRMLSRQLFYTAITRTRGRIVLVADDRGIEIGLREGRIPKRNSTLVERIHGELDEVIDDSAHAVDL
jgi:exodeoxyribonuclease V alpha subunit